MPLLEGTDGVDKMSKSLGNYIGIDESPDEIFGKIMSISDDLMVRYYELLTDEPLGELKKALETGALHPKDAKKRLARFIIEQYHTKKDAERAEANFEKAFKNKGFPDSVPLKRVKIASHEADVISALSMVAGQSKSEIRRKLSEGAIEINGQRVKDPGSSLKKGPEYRVRIGKRFYKARFC